MPDLKAVIVPVTPFQQNCALLWDAATGRGVVVDPGGDVPRILDAVGQHGVQVERILLTHGHIDHAGGAAALREALAKDGAPNPEAYQAFEKWLRETEFASSEHLVVPLADLFQADKASAAWTVERTLGAVLAQARG